MSASDGSPRHPSEHRGVAAPVRLSRNVIRKNVIRKNVFASAALLAAAATIASCRLVHTKGEAEPARGADGVVAMARLAGSGAPVVAATATGLGAPADTITPAMIALGDRIFHGKVGGAVCTTCHGQDARGLPGLGPDLTDGKWLHGDGGLEFLRNIIRTGVPKPSQSATVMPPYGGTPLGADQLDAVAAYVYSLSHQAGN